MTPINPFDKLRINAEQGRSIKVLSQKPILTSELFTVLETQLSINQKTVTHHNIERHPIVSVFPLTEHGELYMIKQYRYLHEDTFLEEVAGHMNKGEDPLVAAKRELKEEVGIVAKDWHKFGEFVGSSSVIKTRIHLFWAKSLTFGIAEPEEDEDITLVKMPLSEAIEQVLAGNVKNSIASLGILMLEILRQKGKL